MNKLIHNIAKIDKKIINKEFINGNELERIVESIHSHQRTDDEWEGTNNEDLLLYSDFLVKLLLEVTKLNDDENDKELSLIFNKDNLFFKDFSFKDFHMKKANSIQVLDITDEETFIVGDLHGDVQTLKRILFTTEFYKKVLINKKEIKLIFLGDYLDRGKRQIELLERLLVLKRLFPQNIFLNRGNHELGNFNNDNLTLGIRIPEEDPRTDYLLLRIDDWANKNKVISINLLRNLYLFFESLPVISALNSNGLSIMLVHGGIPRPNVMEINDKNPFNHLNSISDLTNEDIKDFLGNSPIFNMLWSDPIREKKDYKWDTRRFKFDKEHFDLFSKRFQIDIIIRGHEVFKTGCVRFFGDRLYSIFSSGNVCGVNPDSAYKSVEPKILKLIDGKIETIAIE